MDERKVVFLIEVYVDGSSKHSISGIVGDKVFYEKVKAKSNVHTEYLAIEKAISMLEDNSSAVVYSDSQVAIYQLKHEYGINKEHLRETAIRIWNLISSKNLDIEFKWIPRKLNKAGKILGS